MPRARGPYRRDREGTGLAFALLFTYAMGLHFVLTDREPEERYSGRLGRTCTILRPGASVGGWAVAALIASTSALVVAVLTALLAGSILLPVFTEVVPSGSRTRFPWFLSGRTVYAVLLAAVTALSE